jgi:hypothetical protein
LGHHDTALELLNYSRQHAPDHPEIRRSHEPLRPAKGKPKS